MEINESDIAKKIQQGDFKAFEALFKHYYPILKNFALKHMKDPSSAEEMVQEVFFNLWAKHKTLNIKLSIKSYLFKSTYNCCLQYYKRENYKRKYEQNSLSIQESFNSNPSDELRAKELLCLVDKSLKSLPERCRNIFKLNRFEGLEYREIAEKV